MKKEQRPFIPGGGSGKAQERNWGFGNLANIVRARVREREREKLPPLIAVSGRDKMRKTMDQLPPDNIIIGGGKPKKRKTNTLFLRKRKRTTMIKPILKKNNNSLLLGEKANQKQRKDLENEERTDHKWTRRNHPREHIIGHPAARVRTRASTKFLEREEEYHYHVPVDIWIEILSRLPFLMLLGVRFVCRAWNDIITRSHHHRNFTPAALLGYSYANDLPERTWGFKYSVAPTKTYLTLVDLPSGGEPSAPFKDVRHPCTIHDCSLLHNNKGPTFRNVLIPIASCHGLVCFSLESILDPFFVGNPLLNEELLMVPGSKTNLMTAAMEMGNTWKTQNVRVGKNVVGFGFSPKINCYKIIQFMHFRETVYDDNKVFLRRCFIIGAFEICTICNSCGEHEEPPSWRSLKSFPPQFSDETTNKNLLGSYLKGGIHWLFCDGVDGSIFISRLDLDTEEFVRVRVPQAPNFKTGGKLNLKGMCLGISDGYLNICANIFSKECDIWVMKDYNTWTKQFVVRSPVAFVSPHPKLGVDRNPHVQLLNYAAAEASTRGGVVSEVMLLYNYHPLFGCTTKGGQVRKVELPLCPWSYIVHSPSFLSIKDVAKM